MKRGKRPTRAQKILLSYYRFVPENWLVIKDTQNEMFIKHRHTGTMRTLPKTEVSK